MDDFSPWPEHLLCLRVPHEGTQESGAQGCHAGGLLEKTCLVLTKLWCCRVSGLADTGGKLLSPWKACHQVITRTPQATSWCLQDTNVSRHQTPRHTGIQTPEQPGVQTTGHADFQTLGHVGVETLDTRKHGCPDSRHQNTWVSRH